MASVGCYFMISRIVRRVITTSHFKRGYHLDSPAYALGEFLTIRELDALYQWTVDPPTRIVSDLLSFDHLRDLYATLPTRDGSRLRQFEKPKDGDEIPYGHHLAFFHTRPAERHLREDGTDEDLSPPAPFTTRMWVGGSIRWSRDRPLVAGVETQSVSDVVRVETKPGKPMIFVTQSIKYTRQSESEPSITEERTHVYLHSRLFSEDTKVLNRPVRNLPCRVDFSLNYTPTPITLFRYSALTFNAHSIHLDKEYCQREGFPERLVHGPLMAQMLLETVHYKWPSTILSFTYRARNPVVVNRRQIINATWDDKIDAVHVWCQDDDGVVGMTGKVEMQDASEGL